MLTCVTLTGADDTTNPSDLIALSREFPFVEWGLLIGTSARDRFPSETWFDRLDIEIRKAISNDGVRPNLSIHICGKHLRSILDDGKFIWDHSILNFADRAQLNFHGNHVSKPEYDNIVRAVENQNWPFKEVICQLDGVNDGILSGLLDRHVNATGLHDCSHGAGVKPDIWPAPNPRWRVGYAGGLGPETILEDFEAIKSVAGKRAFWIDMETKLRNDRDEFDLEKCRQVLSSLTPTFRSSL